MSEAVERAAVERWRMHPLCGPATGWPARFWGPEALEPAAWRELAARLEPAAELAAFVEALDGARDVLDVGGGTGLLTRTLAARVGAVTVIEPSDEQRAHAPVLDRVTLRAGRAEALPVGDGAFDAAVATWVLQYTDDPWAAVAELARVARTHVAIVQAAPDNELVRAYNVAAAVAGLPAAHHGYLLAHAAAMLEARGFAVTLARVPVALAIDDAAVVADVLVRLHFAAHPARAAMRAVVEPLVEAAAARRGALIDDGVLLVARR